MIDFRYHIVSLIAVFLALALGILLGAGPLNQTIGDQLTGQVEDLRADRDRLRAEHELAQLQLERRDDYLDAVAPETLGSTLEGRTVALVVLPEAVAEDATDVRHRLEQAGAVVTAQVHVTDAWTDPAAATFRASFTGQLASYLAPEAGADDPTDVVLGAALGQALTRGDDDNAPVADAATLLDLLSSADEPLITIEDEPEEAANATVLLGARPAPVDEEDEPAEDPSSAERDAAFVELARGLATTGEGSVDAGSARSEQDLLATLRADAAAAEEVTTVDSIDTVPGRMNVPLALAAAIAGTTDHYGVGLDATEIVPEPVYLPPPALPDEAAGTDGADADEATTEDDG